MEHEQEQEETLQNNKTETDNPTSPSKLAVTKPWLFVGAGEGIGYDGR